MNTNPTLRAHVATLGANTAARAKGAEKVRRFGEFHDAAHSWSRVKRIIARFDVGPWGVDTRIIVTSLAGGRVKHLYEQVYRRRGGKPYQGLEVSPLHRSNQLHPRDRQ